MFLFPGIYYSKSHFRAAIFMLSISGMLFFPRFTYFFLLSSVLYSNIILSKRFKLIIISKIACQLISILYHFVFFILWYLFSHEITHLLFIVFLPLNWSSAIQRLCLILHGIIILVFTMYSLNK